MNQTDSHDPTQGELSGEVTNRLLMDMPQSPRRAQNRVLTVLGMFVLVLALGGIGFAVLMYKDHKEPGTFYPDLTYLQYTQKISTDEIDPRGASNIYYKRDEAPAGEPGWDMWMKMTIAENSFAEMLDKQRRRLRTMETLPNVTVKATSSRRIGIPTDWSRSANYPLWWSEIESVKEGTDGAETKCNVWDVTMPGKSRGFLWAYDPTSETLWIWEWEGPAGRAGAVPADSDEKTPSE